MQTTNQQTMHIAECLTAAQLQLDEARITLAGMPAAEYNDLFASVGQAKVAIDRCLRKLVKARRIGEN